MPSYVDVRHDVWIHAPRDRVRDHFADPAHRAGIGASPGLSWRCLPSEARGHVRLEHRTLRRNRPCLDVFDRRLLPDGSIIDTGISGPRRGRTAQVSFEREVRVGLAGTLVMIDLRVALPLLLGPLLRPVATLRLGRELEWAAARDKAELESRRGTAPAWDDPRMAA